MRSLLVLVLVLVLVSPSSHAAPPVFRAGAATSNITPFIGGPIVGGFSPSPSTHIHDELHARCLVLDDGQTQLAFVVCDLLGLAREVVDEAGRLLLEETKLPIANLIVSATHTHSATSALGSNRFAVGAPLDDYQRFLARRIADAVRRAQHNLAPARIGWGTASEPREVFNRRWFMKPGTVPVTPFGVTTDQVKMNPPRGSDDLVKPAGPTDPEICFLALQTPDGRPLAVLANYSLHYVGGVGPAHISSDYYGVFCDRLQQLLGADRQDPPFVAAMSNGTSGNINNINFTAKTAEKKYGPYEKMREVADHVATKVAAAYKTIAWHETAPLRAEYRELQLGMRHPTPAQLEYAQKLLATPTAPGKKADLPRIYAERTLGMNTYPPTLPIPLHLFRIGDVAIGSIPCETFVETGLAFKERSPSKPSFIIEIAHGYYGYLPTPEQHLLGGYETWLGTNRLEPEASTKILNALLEMAKATQ